MADGEETALSSFVSARSASGKLAGKYRLQAGELYSMDVRLPTAQRPRLLIEHAAVSAHQIPALARMTAETPWAGFVGSGFL
jgi:hypothetical protein